MRLEHHVVGGYVRNISPYIIIIITCLLLFCLILYSLVYIEYTVIYFSIKSLNSMSVLLEK